MTFISDPDASLLQLTPEDYFTLRDACNGVHIFGGTGSGKTSGSGKALAGAYLRAGMGGLVLCAKPNEVELWKSYCKQHGRSNSVIVFDEKQSFNFIAYEFARQGGVEGASAVVDCIFRLLEAVDQASGHKQRGGDDFWEKSSRQLLNYSIPAIYAAYGNVTMSNISNFLNSAKTSNKIAVTQDEKNAEANWYQTSYAAQTLQRLLNQPVHSVEPDLLAAIMEYWMQEFPGTPEKTRGNMVTTLSTTLNRFKHGRLRKLFCDQTSIVPEMTFHGAIIIMNMPVLTQNDDGLIGQQLFKYMWQRAVDSRNGLEPQHRARPVFLWADEAQYFVNVKDESFLSTCRDSNACVVFMTQSLPTYYSMLGKDRSDAADGIVGKFNTQIFHQNGDFRTNDHASKLVGRGIQHRETAGKSTGTTIGQGATQGWSEGSSTGEGGGSNESTNTSHQGMVIWENVTHGRNDGKSVQWNSNQSVGTTGSVNRNKSTSNTESTSVAEQMDVLIEPNFFSKKLKSGGAPNNKEVTGLWFKVGGKFKCPLPWAGENVILATFKQ